VRERVQLLHLQQERHPASSCRAGKFLTRQRRRRSLRLSIRQQDRTPSFHRRCSIHAFTCPRAAPELSTINLRCLDDFDLAQPGLEFVEFQGED
jgi:hypothetical protein